MKRAISRVPLLLLFLLLALPFSSINASPARAPGDLDTTFGTGGKVITDFGGGRDVGNAVAIQSDGKIVVAGYSDWADWSDFALARYKPDGTLDTSFGTAGTGRVTTDFGGIDFVLSVAIQSDGKIVVAGYSTAGGAYDFALARYNTDGTLDTTIDITSTTSFGTAGTGMVTTDFGGTGDFGQSVAIQSDGKIVVAGSSNANVNYDFALARYNTDGTLDTFFGTGGTGKVFTDFGGVDRGNSVAIQSDGKIVVAGYSNASGSSYDFALARYNTDGTLDTIIDITPATSFGTAGTGMVTTDFGASDSGWSVAIQSDGKLVVAGGSGLDFAVARYHGLSTTGTPGTLDTFFGSGGYAVTAFAGGGYAISVAIQSSNGKIVVVGSSAMGGIGDFAVARYRAPTAVWTPPLAPAAR